ncbi:MAG: hypothetical protein V8R51_03000 [Clostridia bacterium]
MIALIARVGYLQFIDGEHLQTLATSQQTLTKQFPRNEEIYMILMVMN